MVTTGVTEVVVTGRGATVVDDGAVEAGAEVVPEIEAPPEVPENVVPDAVPDPLVAPAPVVGLHEPTAWPAHGPLVHVIGTT